MTGTTRARLMAELAGWFPDMKADSSIKGTGKGTVDGSSMIINGTTTSTSATTITITTATTTVITTVTMTAGNSRGITSTPKSVLVLLFCSIPDSVRRRRRTLRQIKHVLNSDGMLTSRDTEGQRVSAPPLKPVPPGAESTSAHASLTFPLHIPRFPTGMRVDGLQKTA